LKVFEIPKKHDFKIPKKDDFVVDKCKVRDNDLGMSFFFDYFAYII